MISVRLDHCSGLQLVTDSVVWCAVQRRWWTTVWTLQGDVQDYLWRGHNIRQECESRTPCIYVCIFAVTGRCKLCKSLDQIYVFLFCSWTYVKYVRMPFYFWWGRVLIPVAVFWNFRNIKLSQISSIQAFLKSTRSAVSLFNVLVWFFIDA